MSPNLPSRLTELEQRNTHLEKMLLDYQQAKATHFFGWPLGLLCIIGFDGYFRQLNPTWEATLGFTAQELRSQPFLDWVHPEDRDRTAAIFEGLFSGQTTVTFENRYRCQDGSYKYLLWNATRIDDLQPIYAIAHDITARQQAEVALQHKAEELEEALQELKQTQAQLIQHEKLSSLGQLIAGVAHEINNPVNFISGNLFHVKGYLDDLLRILKLYQLYYPTPHAAIQKEAEEIELEFLLEDLPGLLNSMQVGTERIQEIVRSLRTFSRVDDSILQTVNIHECLESTLMILRHRLKENPDHPEIKIIKHYSELPPIECLPGQLNQVFMNIISNAIDALESNDSHPSRAISPTIGIYTENLDEDSILIRIQDNGPGIPEETQPHLFEPFFTTKPMGKGTGLGLSISHQIITEKHHGKLHYQSLLGQGTEFRIELPKKQ